LLRHSSDTEPGITRKRMGRYWAYFDAEGNRVTDRDEIDRLNAIGLPPAYESAWFCADPNGHLQATGIDARGRKQYRYHPEFAAIRDAAKYDHLAEFAAALPAIRRRLKTDLKRKGLPREKVVAVTVALLEETLIRVGNEDYARANSSFGLTTLRNRHVTVKGDELRFLFKGKGGKPWRLSLRDPRVAKIVRSTQELPGQHLLEYRDRDGEIRSVTSSDVNAWLREVSGHDITAKDFRTWAGTMKAASFFQACTGQAGKGTVKEMTAAVAAALGNTIAVCRKCYIHPAVIGAFEAGRFPLRLPAKGGGGLSRLERAVLTMLRRAAV
jgi:DNA topoisomerase-1